MLLYSDKLRHYTQYAYDQFKTMNQKCTAEEIVDNKFDKIELSEEMFSKMMSFGKGYRACARVFIYQQDKKYEIEIALSNLNYLLCNCKFVNGVSIDNYEIFTTPNSFIHIYAKGSEEYKKARGEYNNKKERDNKKTIPAKDLKPGHLYMTAGGRIELYLGETRYFFNHKYTDYDKIYVEEQNRYVASIKCIPDEKYHRPSLYKSPRKYIEDLGEAKNIRYYAYDGASINLLKCRCNEDVHKYLKGLKVGDFEKKSWQMNPTTYKIIFEDKEYKFKIRGYLCEEEFEITEVYKWTN